jgi:hypothetical protein
LEWSSGGTTGLDGNFERDFAGKRASDAAGRFARFGTPLLPLFADFEAGAFDFFFTRDNREAAVIDHDRIVHSAHLAT